MRRVIRAAAAVAIILLLAGCAEPQVEAPRPLTLAEAERLASVRFTNYDAGVRQIEASLSDGDLSLELLGWVDFVDHVGYAVATERGAEASALERSLLHWDKQSLAVTVAPATGIPALPVPAEGWQTVPLDPSANYLSRALAILVSLGADRPENPQLLVQSAARWLRADTLGGTAVDVMSGPEAAGAEAGSPERLRYWVDATGTLVRLELQLGAGDSVWSVIDFAAAEGIVLPRREAAP